MIQINMSKYNLLKLVLTIFNNPVIHLLMKEPKNNKPKIFYLEGKTINN